MSTKARFRAVRKPDDEHFWHIQKRTILGWRNVSWASSEQTARERLAAFENPIVIYSDQLPVSASGSQP